MGAPKRIKVGAEWHQLVVLKVVTRDPLGRPLRVDVLHDDGTKVKLQDGDELVTAYVHASATHKESGAAN